MRSQCRAALPVQLAFVLFQGMKDLVAEENRHVLSWLYSNSRSEPEVSPALLRKTVVAALHNITLQL